ncbi:Cupredoxin [Trichoderma longibrachiatum]|uniref:Cupredoxin n=1 Tax=Trichoderma longibrachiatum ATCC 18648 TaxID=983965 RepID=A0A2T4C9F3_TRILO|nr:Cupredoxin [Trichoderma longibrachiatum ATCC 18648]
MLFSTLAVAALSAVASAKTIRVDVGKSGFNFSPNDIKADKGDILEFHYHALNHSVVAADFAKPCQPKASGGFYSGFFPTGSGENKNVFQVTVNDTATPIWFYCSQTIGNHCSAGMVGAVNANADKTLAMFKSAAERQSSNQSPSTGPFGGRILSASAASQSSGGSSSTTTGSAAAATTTNAAASLGSVGGMALAVVGAAVAFAV